MTLKDYLYIFRRCSSLNSLDRLREKFCYELSGEALQAMQTAAAHRASEISCGQLLDLESSCVASGQVSLLP